MQPPNEIRKSSILLGIKSKLLFTDGTFCVAPKFGYQVFITRFYIRNLNTTYEMLFEEI
ncbi:hypothetical protein U3516DRAFT_738661 [Neocallimastix sp. 'constans']